MNIKSKHCLIVIVAQISMGISACSPPATNEQSLATVSGSEITHREVLENLDRRTTDPTRRADFAKLNLTLETLVQRRLLAQEAKRKGLEKDATFHFAMRRAEEALLIEALKRNIAKTVPRPDATEISAYIESQPTRFDHRYRVLLTNGEAQSELDSFNLPPDNDLSARAKVGNEIVIERRRWTVIRRFEDPIEPGNARRIAMNEMIQRRVQNSLDGCPSSEHLAQVAA